MKPIVFLDIDGVITTMVTKYRTGDPACVAQLNRITEVTGAAIVVSSTWRHAENIKEILAGWGITSEVIGITPALNRWSESGIYIGVERGNEIAKWLADNPNDGCLLILDDDSDMGELLPYLVRTNSYIGLTEADADKAITMLTVQMDASQAIGILERIIHDQSQSG